MIFFCGKLFLIEKKFRFRVYIECKPNLKCNQEVRKNEWIAVYQDAVQ